MSIGIRHECPRCGQHEHVQVTAWINPNTDEVLDVQPPIDDMWCDWCEAMVSDLRTYPVAADGTPFARVHLPDLTLAHVGAA